MKVKMYLWNKIIFHCNALVTRWAFSPPWHIENQPRTMWPIRGQQSASRKSNDQSEVETPRLVTMWGAGVMEQLWYSGLYSTIIMRWRCHIVTHSDSWHNSLSTQNVKRKTNSEKNICRQQSGGYNHQNIYLFCCTSMENNFLKSWLKWPVLQNCSHSKCRHSMLAPSRV